MWAEVEAGSVRAAAAAGAAAAKAALARAAFAALWTESQSWADLAHGAPVPSRSVPRGLGEVIASAAAKDHA